MILVHEIAYYSQVFKKTDKHFYLRFTKCYMGFSKNSALPENCLNCFKLSNQGGITIPIFLPTTRGLKAKSI